MTARSTSAAPIATIAPTVAPATTATTLSLDAHQVADRFERVTAMIEAGNPRAARRATAELAAAADDATAALLRSCLQALERPRVVAVAMLRRLWQDAGPGGRAVVEACVPREPALAPLPSQPGPAQRRRRETTRGPVHPHTTRQGPARGSRTRAGANSVRDAARYFAHDAEAGGVDALTDDPDSDTRHTDYPGRVDDEAPALVPAQGTPCVSCWIERPTAEQHRSDDDGLCAECRDRGAVGIAAPGHDRVSRVQARAAHIAAGATDPEHARSLLRSEYFRAHGADRAVIVDWVDHHLPA